VVLLEAAACGTPCVTGRSGGTVEAVVDGKTGFIIDARERSELVQALNKILSDPDTGSRMGSDGRDYVMRHYPSDHVPESLRHWLGLDE
jgi:phosphatidyl-myo-inositol dimannoside synthase